MEHLRERTLTRLMRGGRCAGRMSDQPKASAKTAAVAVMATVSRFHGPTPALERNIALVLQVISEVDRSHPALTDLALDGVSALKSDVEAGGRVRAVHALKMRVRASNREHSLLGMAPED